MFVIVLETTGCGKQWAQGCSTASLLHRLTELVQCGVFVVNNLHTKPPKKKVSIAKRKIVEHLEVLHVCGGEPSHMFAWPNYGDNCQILNDIAACKVSYSLFFITCSVINSFNDI